MRIWVHHCRLPRDLLAEIEQSSDQLCRSTGNQDLLGVTQEHPATFRLATACVLTLIAMTCDQLTLI